MNTSRRDRFPNPEDRLGIAGLDEERIARFLVEHLENANLQSQSRPGRTGADAEYYSNRDFWQDVVEERQQARAFRWVQLVNFRIADWFPRTPGLYHTEMAERSRREAEHYVVKEGGISFYEPRGKTHMMDGGIGAVRFKPILIEGNESWLGTATSDGYCHSGIPLAIPNYLMERIDFRVNYKITGQIRFLPDFMEHSFYHMTRIPQIYVLVESIRKVGFSQIPIYITPMVFFKGGEARRLAERGNVTYVTCEAESRIAVENATGWLFDYVKRYKGEIITNFDEQRPTFENAPFSLQNVMQGKLDKVQLQEFHIHQAEIICDSIERIHTEAMTMSKNEINIGDNATIYGDVVAAQSIKNSFNKVASSEAPDDVKDLLKKLAVAVEKMSESLPKETAQQAARDLETLVAEATSKSPRKEWWQLSVEGLKKAAINVGEIGKPVLELAGKVVMLLMGMPS
jgi:hypothetical protein